MPSLPELTRVLDGLERDERPWLVRGDCGYGTDRVMQQVEERGQKHLLELAMNKRAKERVQRLAGQGGWQDAGQERQLRGWPRERRVMMPKRRLPEKARHSQRALARLQPSLPGIPVALLEEELPCHAYPVLVTLVTTLRQEVLTVAQLGPGPVGHAEHVRRAEEPIGLGKVPDAAADAAAAHGAAERVGLQLVVDLRADAEPAGVAGGEDEPLAEDGGRRAGVAARSADHAAADRRARDGPAAPPDVPGAGGPSPSAAGLKPSARSL